VTFVVKNIGVLVFAAIFVFKISLSLWQASPVFIDEILYADITAEISHHNKWQMRFPHMFHSYPTLYSASLSPSFILLKNLGMQTIYFGMLLLNNVLSLIAAWAAFATVRFLQRRGSSKIFPWICAGLVLLWPTFAVYQITLLSENLFIPLYLVSVFLLMKSLSKPNDKNRVTKHLAGIGFGIVIGILFSVRNVNGALLLPAALLVLAVYRQWKVLGLAAIGLIIGLALGLGPEYFWGAGKLHHYNGSRSQIILALNWIRGNENGWWFVLERICYSFLYPVLTTLIFPILAAFLCRRRMPAEWRAAWLFVWLGFVFLVPGCVLHTFSETPGNCDMLSRYYDPFVVGWVVLGLAALPKVKFNRNAWILFAGLLILALVLLIRVRFNWWMNTLPLAHLRLLKRNYPVLVYVFAGLLTAGSTTAAWLVIRRKWLTAIFLGLFSLSVLDIANAYHYRQYGVVMKKMNMEAQTLIGSKQHVKISRLARQLTSKRSNNKVFLRLSVYFWTLDNPDFIVK
jgi:hypothetical protein